jgi:hypothetical protein
MPLVPVTFSIPYIKNPDSFVFARWSLSTSEAKCLRPSPSAGMLELLALFIGVPELLMNAGEDLTALGWFVSATVVLRVR